MNENKYMEAEQIISDVLPMLVDKPPDIVAVVVGDLMAWFISSHAPIMRDQVLKMRLDYIEHIIQMRDAERKAKGQWPSEWK